MYVEFFNFTEEPFGITPNPKFLFLSRQHEEAIESLLYGINNRRGFMAVIGDIGTGKTTLCRALMNRLGKDIDTSVILNPILSVHELLRAINDDFGNPDATGDTIKAQIDALNKFMLRRLNWNKNAVLVIDEAQALSVEAMEMIRLLSNLETDEKKLLQIVFMGQQELLQKLRRPDLRQLDQRIGIRCALGPLLYSEACKYIAHRLFVAGGMAQVQFEEKALREIYSGSGGVPRLINLICDRALLFAYAERSRTITKRMALASACEINGWVSIRPTDGSGAGAKFIRWLTTYTGV